MILAEMKELEDAKQELSKLSNAYSIEYQKDKERIFSELKTQFKEFVSEGGFSFSERGNSLIAQYGSIELKLTFPGLDEAYFGAVTVLEFLNSSQPRVTWDISVVNAKQARGPAISITTGRKSELDSVKEEIERTQKKLPYTPLEYSICYRVHRSQAERINVPTLVDALTAILGSK